MAAAARERPDYKNEGPSKPSNCLANVAEEEQRWDPKRIWSVESSENRWQVRFKLPEMFVWYLKGLKRKIITEHDNVEVTS